MSKKHAILLPFWMNDYLSKISSFWGIKFADILRSQVCLAILFTVEKLYPDYNNPPKIREVFETIISQEKEKLTKDEKLQYFSMLSFEARKAAEFRLKKIERKVKIRPKIEKNNA